jgi:hypothetical protein
VAPGSIEEAVLDFFVNNILVFLYIETTMDMDTTIALAMLGVMTFWVYQRNNAGYVKDSAPKPPGRFSFENLYDFVSPMKHDITKQVTLNIIPFLVLTYVLKISTGQTLFSTTDFFGSIVGRSLIDAFSFFVFYQIVQPYVVNVAPDF